MLKLGTVVFATDFSDCSNQAFDDAVLFAAEHGAALHLFHALAKPDSADFAGADIPEEAALLDQLEMAARRQLDKLAAGSTLGPLEVKTATRIGIKPSELILDYVAEVGGDALVIGTHGRRGPQRWFLGSVAEDLLRHATCPVLVVPERESGAAHAPIRKVLVPIDFSETSVSVLYEARELARAYDAHLALLHVVDLPITPSPYGDLWTASVSDLEELSLRELESLADEVGLTAEERELATDSGTPSAAIVDFVATRDCGLIIMPARSPEKPGLLGSTTDLVLRRATCPVLTLPPLAESTATSEALSA